MTTKTSVSLPDEDIAFIDSFAAQQSITRSKAVSRAINALRARTLSDMYQAAWDEWDTSEAPAWEPITADGIANETW